MDWLSPFTVYECKKYIIILNSPRRKCCCLFWSTEEDEANEQRSSRLIALLLISCPLQIFFGSDSIANDVFTHLLLHSLLLKVAGGTFVFQNNDEFF